MAAVLGPVYSGRILWLANLPTGLLLGMMGVFIPESAKFLMARGRREEAQRIMARFGSGIRRVAQDASGTARAAAAPLSGRAVIRSEEHTSELQSLMRISYAVFCLKKKKSDITETTIKPTYI